MQRLGRLGEGFRAGNQPRDRYTTRVTTTTPPGKWTKVHVDVLDGETVIVGYDRNYSMLQTFEPFRQGDRNLALISTHYTATSVMDLHTGDIIAAEEPAPGGFCRRDDRFGYLKLATDTKLEPRDFIRCSSWQGERRVEFYIGRGYNLTTGQPIPDEDW